MKIIVDDISRPEVIEFLHDHLQHMIKVTPPGCVHALDLDALKKPEVTFWTAWQGSSLIGCGALKMLNANEAELKSMRTAPSHLRQGVASYLLEYLIAEAQKQQYHSIYLETGAGTAFEPARKLYEKTGFRYCGPFADYVENVNSIYMILNI